MKKSILKRLLLGSICVVMVSFIITGTFFFSLLMNMAINDKVSNLERNVAAISEISSVAINSNSMQIMEIYRSVIDSVASNTDSFIIVFDKRGNIITVSGLEKNKYIGAAMNPQLAKPILNGNRYYKTGLLNDYFEESTLTVGSPLHDKSGIIGGILFNVPVPRIHEMNVEIFKRFAGMSVIALCFSVIVYYLISRKITVPIKKMSLAVTEFAKGNFSKRVEYSGDDELGELAANFNSMATELENLENMRSSFVANVSHELRTPLTTITGFLDGVLDGTIKGEDRKKYLETALDETKRITRMVNDLLNISKMESENLKLTPEPFNINELVVQELFKFENAINDKKINVELNLSENNPIVNADKDAIIQVVTNLTHNAVKFTPESGDIWISTWTDDQKAYVEIKNSGYGIEKEKINFIFDRFYKTDDSRSNDKTGVGLGLFIVKNLISRHDEKIWAESELNKYTRFVFSLKLD